MGSGKEENKLHWFESVLRSDIDESNIDYTSVELRLDSRIEQAEDLGALAMLKKDEITPHELLDRVEKQLYKRIDLYREYEEPVNECINTQEELPRNRWIKIEDKLDDSITELSLRDEWENIIMTPKISTQKQWEQREEKLFEKIKIWEQNNSEWEEAASQEELEPPFSIESRENEFDKLVSKVDSLSDWELYLRAEKVPSCGFWERVEENLFSKINSDQKSKGLGAQPFWIMIDYYLNRLSSVKYIGVVLFILVVGALTFNSFNYLNDYAQSIPTLVFQAQGADAEIVDFLATDRKQYSSNEGGFLKLVNKYGFIELQNGSALEIEHLSTEMASYRVGVSNSTESKTSQQRAVFYVNEQRTGKRFNVSTPDYDISVTGTYFSVKPEDNNRFTTQVLEGSVIIKNGAEAIELKAGQSYIYDAENESYSIRDGGIVVSRSEITRIPAIEELLNYRVLIIRSNTPGCSVKIDGRYYGSTPLALYRSEGDHRVELIKDGYETIDTLITIADESVNRLEFSMLAKAQEQKQRPFRETSAVVKTDETGEEDQPVQQLSNVEQIYRTAREYELSGSWNEALELYTKLYEDETVRDIYREDALFSIGKIKSEHVSQIEAKRVFHTYLDVFPLGLFAGESWLRLAELEFAEDQTRAVQYYHNYFELFPNHYRTSELQNRVGLIYLQQNKYNEAIAMFQTALENMAPSQKNARKSAYINLHNALRAKGDEAKAQLVMKEYRSEFDSMLP
ncbi:PEGA domain-containing protein [Chitinispirillales bacterium ANBcel5]|uniref:PEGA domain-containing protein n=1 Tax=Cellulosispirillum alkaliphilum TaxID=3039283 RepID=UPI002A594AC7|nr:PEGA domain-containing protein [Chitinispirillales bacterium ANBcel5]